MKVDRATRKPVMICQVGGKGINRLHLRSLHNASARSFSRFIPSVERVSVIYVDGLEGHGVSGHKTRITPSSAVISSVYHKKS